ncbi:ARM repeat-containing protein [Colletotrichum falcatum]|nr:ARM repeat-containing protein [Colletotrichum falcatum]
MDELRFRSQPPPRNDPTMNTLVSPPRNGNRLPQPVQAAHDGRGSLPRRFTTDSGRVPTLSSITNQRGPDIGGQDYNNTLHKVQLIEKKKIEYERLREQRRRFEMEMQKLEQAQRREEMELAKMQDDLRHGHQSEPTTPPEYHESSGFPTMFSRPNRYSTSSLTSPPGLFNRPGRSGSQLTSPQSALMQSRFNFDDHMPSRSVPGSRRNSDEDEKEEAVRQDPTSHRSSNAYNRYSMPVTRSRTGLYGADLDQTGTTRFLFGEEDTSGDNKYGQNNGDDNFPTLVRRDDQMSLSAINTSAHNGAPSGDIGNRSSVRHSLDLKFYPDAPSDNNQNPVVSPTGNHMMATPPKLQSSFSANDVPTVKTTNGGLITNNHAQQHFHNHNASIGRIPAGAVAGRHSRELSNDNSMGGHREQSGPYPSIQSALQANAAPFGPGLTPGQGFPHTSQGNQNPNGTATAGPGNGYGGFYPSGYISPNSNGPPTSGPYGLPLLAMSMQNMNLNNGNTMYPPQNYAGYGSLYTPQQQQQQPPQSQPRDSQARVIQHRRQMDNEAMSRYNGLALENVGGQIYDLCKDQHGCRYLQKKLEERNPEQVHMIWLETNQHVIELMTDPFGNYLCQKLLEFCNDDERTVLIQNAAADMVRIALNQHGTRALQKMIEFVTTPTQIEMIINALRFQVVELIQDLNGNHVIQKCLNKLSAQDAQFIFDAVGTNCVDVGTHRHGCCVLQRCIDHASGDQKTWLIAKITDHAPILVQDPFGNYVVQYIIDLNEPSFTEPIVRMFQNRIGQLSRHKFSSNVIEKCLRCSQEPSRDMIVEELLTPGEIERLLRDSYANYVIQTALEYATPHGKYRLVDAIRPILPSIRSTPYGRRIQAKIQAFEGRGSASSSGQVTPADATQGQIPLRSGHNRAMSNNTSIISPGGAFGNGLNGAMASRGNQASYPAANNVTVPPPGPQSQRVPQFGFNAQQRAAAPTETGAGGEAQWL